MSDKEQICMPVKLSYNAVAKQEITGNGDSTLNAGESYYLDIQLHNDEDYSSTSFSLDMPTGSSGILNAVISTTSPYITINTSGLNDFEGLLKPGTTLWAGGTDAFKSSDMWHYAKITVLPGSPVGDVNFTLTINQSSTAGMRSTTTTTFTIPIEKLDADIQFVAYANNQISSYAGNNGDAFINVGEWHFLDVKLKNAGTVDTDSVKVTNLTTTDSNVILSIPDYPYGMYPQYAPYGNMSSGASGWINNTSNGDNNSTSAFYATGNHFEIRVTGGYYPRDVFVTMTIKDAYGNIYSPTFKINVY